MMHYPSWPAGVTVEYPAALLLTLKENFNIQSKCNTSLFYNNGCGSTLVDKDLGSEMGAPS